jgi:hypothetical protein
MRIGVCGVACEICPRQVQNLCPNGSLGCTPKANKFCRIATGAFDKNIRYCFQCAEFPCETTKSGPIGFGYCEYIAGKSS